MFRTVKVTTHEAEESGYLLEWPGIEKSKIRTVILFSFIIFLFPFSILMDYMPRILAKPVTSSVNVADIPKSNQASAYFEIFKDLCERDSYLVDNSLKYIAVDLSGVIYDDVSNLTALLLDYCDKNGKTLLMDTYDGLKKKKYIKDWSFKNGCIVSFVDFEIGENMLFIGAIIQGSWLRSGGYSAKYTVRLIDGEWKITKTYLNDMADRS